jgi:hypothetical protein
MEIQSILTALATWGKNSLSWLYWIVGLLIIGGISNILYTRFNKQITAVLVFLTSFLALYYYYVKWFIVASKLSTPPISICPDFMTLLGPVRANSNQYVCVDRVGVSTQFTPINESTALPSAGTAATIAGITTDTTIPAAGKVYNGGEYGVVITANPNENDKTVLTSYCTSLKDSGISAINLCSTFV